MNNKFVNLLKLFFTPLAIAFLVYFAWVTRDELAALFRSASPQYLAAATVLWAGLHAVSPLIATTIFGACGSDVSWRQAFATHAARLPARYVPGGIWHTVGRVLDYREQGVETRHISAFVVLENGLAAAVTLALGGAIVFVNRVGQNVGIVAALGCLVGAVGLFLLLPVVNKKVLGSDDRVSVAGFVRSIFLVVLFWAGAAVAFLLYLYAFTDTTGSYSVLELAGIYLFSWGVGFLAIFAPQGIGVFEVVASELAASPIGLMGFAALVAGFRVVVLLADILVWFVHLGTRRRA